MRLGAVETCKSKVVYVGKLSTTKGWVEVT